MIAPLPELPVADLPEVPEGAGAGALNWKTSALVRAAAGRPFIWVDDAITELDRAWLSTHHRGPALLPPIDSRTGLTEPDFAVLDDWLTRCLPHDDQVVMRCSPGRR
ncbi:hypothetical protein [Streptomyces camelliae]|uniref:hypothetical protein n=1 Tax=Streptomyces camelliae TaxID=3004093 RepID=UPI003D175503